MRISDWSSDVCSSDLVGFLCLEAGRRRQAARRQCQRLEEAAHLVRVDEVVARDGESGSGVRRAEEHTSELQSLMRNSYAVFCLKKKITTHTIATNTLIA